MAPISPPTLRPFTSVPNFAGPLSQLSVADLLQTAENGRRSGVVRLTSGEHEASLWLRHGRVVDAVVDGGPRGREAVYAVALWTEGRFEASFGEIETPDSIGEPTSALLLEAMRLHDEAQRDGLPNAALPDPPPAPPAPRLALHRGVTLLNIAASAALDAAEPGLVAARLEQSRRRLLPVEPVLAIFRVGGEAAVTCQPGVEPTAVEPIVRAIATWLTAFWAALDFSFPGRFSMTRLAQASAAISDDLASLGFHRALGLEPTPSHAVWRASSTEPSDAR